MSEADERDEAAVVALAGAMRRGWPARAIDRAAEGWARLLIVALRADPDGRRAVVEALRDRTTDGPSDGPGATHGS